jgi:creatinine amidohydrolase/Fe(II)-dependent formamide hydrolase-like protein
MDEVRFDRMVPVDIRARREAFNLAYLPVGSLEWHGPHMPFGTDYMTVAYIAEECAKRYGGVAFPPMFYGDVRYHLQECRVEWRQSYIKDMGVPEEYAAAFGLENPDGSPGYDCPTRPDDGPEADDPLGFSLEEQERFFVHLIAKTMLEMHLYGFRNILLLPGHGPNPGFCLRAMDVYLKNVARRSAFGPPARVMSYFYIDAAKETEPLTKEVGLHADKWEGSFVMAAAPGTVRPDQLPPPGELVPAYLFHPYLTETEGYNPEMQNLWWAFDALDPRNGMSEEYGREQSEGVIGILGEKIREFMQGQ